jgi:hypothetical protein
MSFEIRQFGRSSDPFLNGPPETGITAQTTATSQNTGLIVPLLPTAVSYTPSEGPFQSSNSWQGSGTGEDAASTTVTSMNTEESAPGRTTSITGPTPGLQSGAPVAASSSSKGSNLSNGAVAGVAIGA